MHFSKKHTVIPLTIILLCIIARGILFYSASAYPLANFSRELALDMLKDNPLELHYSIAYPEKLGLENISANLIPFHSQYYLQNKTIWSERARTLQQIDPAHFDRGDRYLYNLLQRHIQLQLKSLDFPYYENPLSCSGGVHSQLPILLAEYALRSKADIENYFTLLSQIPAYLDGLAEYARAQELNGIYLYEGNIREVQDQCRELFPQKQLSEQTHFLQTSFHTRLQKLADQSIITSDELTDYESRNTSLLQHKIAPAYEALATDLGALEGKKTLTGLSAYPRGKAYYEVLLAGTTGSSRSVKEIKTMLYERYDTLFELYTELSGKGTFVQQWDFPLSTHKEMLQHLYEQAQENFPSLSELSDGAAQQVHLKTVNGILAGMSAPAFYMTPPIDANDEHTIYINPDAQMESLDLYTTLAHEGFPGHLYQTVYSQKSLELAGAPLIRQLLYYGGFTEGWAVYAELYSYDFAAQACGEKLEDTIALYRCYREIQLCLCSILDIFVHYEGATLEQVKDLLTSLGLSSSSAEAIYEVICDSPANYPKYYVGYLEILSLKEAARSAWGNDFSEYAFHKWLLEQGGGDFDSLQKALS